MTERISLEDQTNQLGRMSLFVIPVTMKLLTEPNRAMDEDVPFAIENHIPLLPIMMEGGLDPIYCRPDKFGDRKYLMPGRDTDRSGLSYTEKLSRYLKSVLLDDKTAERVRNAFDCYVFLSYRWKDRYHADELMRLVHKDPRFRDVATWYDEFLVPGEGFNEAIAEALRKSKLYTMVVTDNLINEDNYIQAIEYPAAHRAGKAILPVEMETTDRSMLETKFDGIPDCVPTEDEQYFYAALLESLHDVALQCNRGDPEHDFLMGLAYLEGIDVEVDRSRALKLITSAARAGLLEAVEQLANMYLNGNAVPFDYDKARFWVQELYVKSKTGSDADPSVTLRALNMEADMYKLGGVPLTARTKQLSEVYNLSCRVFGKENPDTALALSNLAASEISYPAQKRVIEMQEQAYELSTKLLAENDPRAISILHNWAIIYKISGNVDKAIEYQSKVYDLQCQATGETSVGALTELFSLSLCQAKAHDFAEAKRRLITALEQTRQIYGDRHPSMIPILKTLAYVCDRMHESDLAVEYEELSVELCRSFWGKEEMTTISAQTDLAISHAELGHYERALELQEEAYSLMKKFRADGEQLYSSIGEPLMFVALENLADINSKLGRYDQAIKLYEKLHQQRRYTEENDSPSVLRALGKVALNYEMKGDQQKAIELLERICAVCDKPEDPYPTLLQYTRTQLQRICQCHQEHRNSECSEESGAENSAIKTDWYESAPFSSYKEHRRIIPVTLYD